MDIALQKQNLLFHSSVILLESALSQIPQQKFRVGFDFVYCELIGGSHVSDRLPRPHDSKHIIRQERCS